jgi:hypothetical protein
MIRSVTTVEPEWDDDERVSMLALTRCEDRTCSGCGGWLPETLVHEAEDYAVTPPSRCGQCTVLAIHQDYHNSHNKHTHALRWSAKLKPNRRPVTE